MDICDLILEDHAEQRRLFAQLEQIDASNTEALSALWKRLSAFLETHAEGEEEIFYPAVLKVGKGAGDKADPPAEVKDAIKDHNEIRDAVEAVGKHKVGSPKWIAAIDKANEANSDHMGEEEREGLTDMRRNASLDLRHALGVRFAAFDATHIDGVTPVNKSPREYIRENS